jgi:serine/threonine protein kinase
MIFLSKNEELLEASEKGDVEKVKKLLKKGADVNAKNFLGFTSLHIAASAGHIEVVKLLIENGANVNAKDNVGWTPLYNAAIYGHIEVVKLLIEKGADVNAKANYGTTPLHEAAYHGHIEVVRLLLEHGADPYIKTNDGKTAIDIAREKGYSDIVKLIKEFISFQILSIESPKLYINEWGKIIVKVKGKGKISINLKGDVEWIKPEPKEISGESIIEIPVKPKVSGEVPVKVIIDSPYGKDSSTVFLKVEKKEVKLIQAKTPIIVSEKVPVEKKKKVEDKISMPEFPIRLLKKYEPIELLGKGGFALVFKAKRKEDGKITALKIPKLDDKAGKAFLNEVNVWLSLNHKNIVSLIDANVIPFPYLELEFIDGVELNGKIIKSVNELPKPLKEDIALKIIKGIAEGLKYAHSKNIIHADLKPANILIAKDFEAKITDWGLSKLYGSEIIVKGLTPLYAAPEQLDPSYGSIDQRTDIFQLGIIFYELLTGKNPFRGYTFEEVKRKITDESIEIPKPSSFNSSLKKYDEIIMKALSRRKDGRFNSIEDFLLELERIEAIDIEKKIEELKLSLSQSRDKLNLSKSQEEFQDNKKIVVKLLCDLCLLCAEANKKPELLNYLNDLRFYCFESLNDLFNAIKHVEYMMKEGIRISEEFKDRLKVLTYNIKRENKI